MRQHKLLCLKQNVFAVNELHMVSDSGRSGYPISISYTINNTDQFVAFQFDIVLPSVLTFIEDSVWLFRKTNHIIIANLINQQTLRIVAYSPTNQPFTGNNGEITSGVIVEYNIPGNTYSVGKTNFWTYAQQLFGLPQPLPDNIGLTGKGLTGTLDPEGNYYFARGIPITPFQDNNLINESPFQLIHLVAKDQQRACRF